MIADGKIVNAAGGLQAGNLRSLILGGKITIGGASVQTAAGHPGTGPHCLVRLWTDGDCRVSAGGVGSTAGTNDLRLTGSATAPHIEYFVVRAGDRVNVIAA